VQLRKSRECEKLRSYHDNGVHLVFFVCNIGGLVKKKTSAGEPNAGEIVGMRVKKGDYRA